MDWFAWLSKTGLDHSLVYEYGLAFAHNELEEEDITYFNHEFLQSMGISIAKHRLQIINHARKQRIITTTSHSIWKLVSKTKKRLVKYIRMLVVHKNSSTSSALVVLPSGNKDVISNRWKGSMLKRSTTLQGRRMMSSSTLMLTNGTSSTGYNSSATSTPRVVPGGIPMIRSSTSPRFYEDGDDDYDDGYWSSTGAIDHQQQQQQQQQQQIIKWDAMFQDLKPT